MRRLLTGLAMVLMLGTAQQVQAAMITYGVTNLVDTTSGEDLWEYSYQVSGTSFAKFEGFSIYFAPAIYKALESPPPAVPGWNPTSVQPDLGLLSSGFFDAQALMANPSLSFLFTVKFVWLGSGTPGPQAFDLYRVDPNSPDPNNPNFIFGVNPGITEQVSTVPEPSTMVLAGSGLMLLARRLRRRRRQANSE